MIRTFLDILFTSLIFTLIFFISYEILVIFKITIALSWYTFFIIGFSQTILLRLFGRLIGSKNVSKQVFKN